MKKNNLIQIFKPGTHVTMGGDALSFSEADIAATAAAYDPALKDAPLVVGHPKTDDPAFGWTQSLQFADGILSAVPRDVYPAFGKMVNDKLFPKISAAFYHPQSPNNPVPGVYYLRHIGFLGAHPPAVAGLAAPQFADGDDAIIIEFGESDPTGDDISAADTKQPTNPGDTMTPDQIAAKAAELDKQAQALQAQQTQIKADADALAVKQTEFGEREAKLAQVEFATKLTGVSTFVESLVANGQVLPRDKAGLVAFMAAENTSDTIEFGEGDAKAKTPGLDWFKNEFLAKLPKQVEFGEIAGNSSGEGGKVVSDKQIAGRAVAYRNKQLEFGINISVADAVDAVNANLDLVKS
jgi:hypothetical protein